MNPYPETANHPTTRGYFGRIVYFARSTCGLNLAISIDRTHQGHLFKLDISQRTVTLLRLPLRPKFHKAQQHNLAFRTQNLSTLSQLPSGIPCAFFVLDRLEPVGGVERRLSIMLNHLKERGIQPVLVLEEHHYEPLKDFPTVFLKHCAPNATAQLMEMVEYAHPVLVEFNMKDTRLFHDIDLNQLKERVKTVGCMLHGYLDLDPQQMRLLDYRCSVSTRFYTDIEDIVNIPNAVAIPEIPPPYNVQARYALYVGRIDDEKLPTLQNFIKICEQFGFKYHIAGSISSQTVVQNFVRQLPAESLIGAINTREYLQTHSRDYAFIGGVGQVPLEAGVANLPALICTHLDDPLKSAVLCDENVDTLVDWNCVIRKIPEEDYIPNVADFMDALATARDEQSTAPLKSFQVRNQLKALRGITPIMNKYINAIRTRTKTRETLSSV